MLLVVLSVSPFFVNAALNFSDPIFSSFDKSSDKVKRRQGQNFLLSLAMKQERYYFMHGTYTNLIVGPDGCSGASCGLNLPANTSDPEFDHKKGWYTAVVTEATSKTFSITVMPVGWVDGVCGNLTYNADAQRGSSIGLVKECW